MRKSILIKILLLTLTVLLLLSCGEGKVTLDPTQYAPKIAIEGFLTPNKRVSRIWIWRNFPVDQDLTRFNLALENASVTITEIETNEEHTLFYVPDSFFFKYFGNDLTIDYKKSYRLDVRARIDGTEIRASSTTTVPDKGLKIVSANYDSLKYRQRDGSGNIINFNIELERSPGTNFYLATVLALDADPATFIYDNPFTDETPEDVANDLNDFRFNFEWIQDTPLTPGRSNMELFWFDFWFYSSYEVIVFAADRNYKDFAQTYNEVQEFDGNFHEPVFHIDGDGIGIFGSVVVDTVYLKVIP